MLLLSTCLSSNFVLLILEHFHEMVWDGMRAAPRSPPSFTGRREGKVVVFDGGRCSVFRDMNRVWGLNTLLPL